MYHLVLKFGDKAIPVNSSLLRELTIIQDLNKFLPEFRLRIEDVSGILTHVLPFDKEVNNVFVEVGESASSTNRNSFSFRVFDREPESENSSPSTVYDIIGALAIDNLISPDYSRGWNQSVSSTIQEIATAGNTGIQTDISSSLSYTKNIIQPNWSNIQTLRYLKNNLLGSGGESNFKCFFKNYNGKTTLVFKSTEEMIKNHVAYKFIVSDIPKEDFLPIFKYAIYDNHKVVSSFASRVQQYGYFDYDSSEYVEASESVDDFYSLADFHLVDKDEASSSCSLVDNGTNNEFTSDFKGRAKGSYHNRLLKLSQMWITVSGLATIVPGDTVQVFFPHGVSSGQLYDYQYSGYWLVERVVHQIGDVFLSKILLCRNGIDTSLSNTLIKATKKKR